MGSFIFGLISGHLFSKGADAGQGKFHQYIQERDLSGILDEYDAAFMRYHDTEITLNKCDMGAVFEKRAFLISCAKKYFIIDNSDIKKNVKQEFIDSACKEIGDSSEAIKTYLDRFYLLVFTKETKEVSAGFRAFLNAYADTQHEINKKTEKKILKHDKEIGGIKEALVQIQDDKKVAVDFMPYYQIVEERFIEEKEEDSLVGSESDEKAYIDAYIETEDDSVSILFFLDEWFGKKKSGTMLIHGEPGHGKTMLCRKAMVEFYRGKYLKGKAENVIAVSLNTGENRSIISEGKVLISNALAWGVEQEHRFTFEDCRGSLLFLDGFDEFIDDAKRTDVNIANICSFMKKVNNIAKTYGIHIVVLSRSVAVENDLKNLTGICKHFQLSPVSEIQQDEWMECHPEYSSYGETFQKIRKNSDMHVLLGVPLLFRLIVHNQFDETSSNVVDLYDKLFIHLMNKRNIYKDIELRLVEKELMTLAYEVYCTDSNMAVLENVIEDPHWLFTFYVKTSGNGKIGFFHRTFYQYFFAKFIFWGIINLKDKEEETFIGLFAERELDYTIRKYLSLLFNEENIPTVYSSAEKLIIALSQTEAYLNFEPHVDSGDAERSRIVRSENIYRNTLHIAASLSYVIQLPFKEKLELLMRTYNSTGIVLVSKKDKRADLSGVNLNGVYLCEADLSEADLSGADFELANLSKANLSRARLNQADFELSNLSGANLSRADLSRADLSRANLNGADLFRANLLRAGLFRADLSGTDLRGADLRGADMGGADLRKANLRGANLTGVDLNGANLNGADLSGTDLSGVELFRASLSGANLSGANLSGADLSGANLIGADLRGADLNGTIIEVMKYKANLYRAKIDVRYKGKIDPSTEESSSIEWF